MSEKKLTPRLEAVCNMVPVCRTCADIGCDHGQVSLWLVRNGKVSDMTAADVNHGPLSRAEAAVREAGLEDKIRCVLTDGLENIPAQDCVIIAGMGGDLISDILSRAEWTRSGNRTLILQPMTAAYRLRKYLCENGYCITREEYAAEREKLYAIISAEPGEQKAKDLSDFYISRAGERHPLCSEYAGRVVKKLANELEGLMKGESCDCDAIEHRREAIRLINNRFFK